MTDTKKEVDRFELGTKTRISFLGKKAAGLNANSLTDFNRPLRVYLTESLWGTIMSRPGISKKTRMLVNVALMAALQPQILKRYVKGAINCGATRQEIAEVLLQVTGYCGAPCGVQSFEEAEEAFKELDQESKIRNKSK
ncbi:MAG: carboxymuconolactone decarboxylase family protein [Thaumarchaeota archaeon]|nr:carboxymuconolactone decarboxylase family protein [Nitrososphaerota archaeon]